MLPQFARAMLASAVALLAACATIPKDALVLSPDTLERRQLQTRRFDAADEKQLLAASAGVLQDLGFNIDESETKLGVIVASKDRSAISAGQITAAVFLALLSGTATPVDKTQKIRVSLVARAASAVGPDVADATGHLVRVTFQRIVWNTQGQITRIESIEDPLIYQEFFEKLSKSLFLEAQKI